MACSSLVLPAAPRVMKLPGERWAQIPIKNGWEAQSGIELTQDGPWFAEAPRGIIPMDLNNVLAQLRDERDALDAAISNLERLEHDRHRSPGRQPGLVTKSSTNGTSNGHSLLNPAPGEA